MVYDMKPDITEIEYSHAEKIATTGIQWNMYSIYGDSAVDLITHR